MASVRRNLRLIATTWLVLQVAWLTALVPRDCCPVHRPGARPDHGSHHSNSASQCPMRSPDGRRCSMHAGAAGHGHRASGAEHHHQAPAGPDGCSVRGVCDGPMAALFAFQSTHGILPASNATLPDLEFRSVDIVRERLIARFRPPDPPPPRA
jgi:hypothetical protein